MFRHVAKEQLDETEAARQLERVREQRETLVSTCRDLLYILKLFSFDISEIGADEFKARIEDILDLLAPEFKLGGLGMAFGGNREYLASFAEREKAYFHERDGEYRSIIELLHTSLVDMVGENRDLSEQVIESGSKLEELTRLDDIRQIKEGLRTEIELVRQAFREKQEKDLQRITRLSQQIGALKSSLEEVREISMTDPLTGLKNRLSFDSYIRASLERHCLSNQTFSMLMCDIDDFKKVNDTYGHQVGDCLLKVFADQCRKMSKPEDFIARYGGEEFVLILPQSKLRSALRRAEQICNVIATNEHPVNMPPVFGTLRFKVSIGVAEARKSDTVDTLIARADQALYAAKRSGKNRALSERDAEKALGHLDEAA